VEGKNKEGGRKGNKRKFKGAGGKRNEDRKG